LQIVLKGLPASVGTSTGRVKTVKTPADYGKMTEGDILVCPTSSPSMIEIMQQAAAIVTDYGGMGSHPAIIARELGIPCVVGTNDATRILEDDTEVTVDGTRGVVYVKD
jgi:phosphoenolpyruvate synthase/pyruvate phosphate dikinase